MTKEIVSIKGTRHGLVICLSSGNDFEELLTTLRNKMETSNGFFKGANFVFLQEKQCLSAEEIAQLENICYQHGLVSDLGMSIPVGLTAAASVETTAACAETATACVQTVAVAKTHPKNLLDEPSVSLPSIGILEEDALPCLRIDKNIRSGQRVNFDGHIIVEGDVNPGSEITASGDVIVLGSLRGTVHAGAGGAAGSVIVAYRMNPVQVRISSFVSRAPDNSKGAPYPEIARLRDGSIIIEPYSTFGLRRAKFY